MIGRTEILNTSGDTIQANIHHSYRTKQSYAVSIILLDVLAWIIKLPQDIRKI